MLISSLLYLLSSNAVTSRRNKSILYAKVVLTILVSCFILCSNIIPLVLVIKLQSYGLYLFCAIYRNLELIKQMKGYFYVNLVLALSLSITIFSFISVSPLIGFLAKQMILSSALDNGYIFVTFIATLASAISACCYLALINQIFFQKSDYQLNSALQNISMAASLVFKRKNTVIENLQIGTANIKLTTSLTVTISVLTLIILLFILNPQE